MIFRTRNIQRTVPIFLFLLVFFSGQAQAQDSQLSIKLHIEQEEVFVCGVATGWLEITNNSKETVKIISGFQELEAPLEIFVKINGRVKRAGHWMHGEQVVGPITIQPGKSIRKPICLFSDRNGSIFNEVGKGGIQIRTVATLYLPGIERKKLPLTSNHCFFSIVGGKKGREEFQNKFAGYGLGFVGMFPGYLEKNYREIFKEYSRPYLQIMSYRHNSHILESYVASKGQYWRGKSDGIRFSEVVGEMKALTRQSGAGWWLWEEVEQQMQRFQWGDSGIFKSGSQIGNLYLAH